MGTPTSITILPIKLSEDSLLLAVTGVSDGSNNCDFTLGKEETSWPNLNPNTLYQLTHAVLNVDAGNWVSIAFKITGTTYGVGGASTPYGIDAILPISQGIFFQFLEKTKLRIRFSKTQSGQALTANLYLRIIKRGQKVK